VKNTVPASGPTLPLSPLSKAKTRPQPITFNQGLKRLLVVIICLLFVAGIVGGLISYKMGVLDVPKMLMAVLLSIFVMQFGTLLKSMLASAKWTANISVKFGVEESRTAPAGADNLITQIF
jgi:cytochrome b subunit of formate dehydrogenase